MIRYLLGRLAMLLAVLLGVLVLTFVASRILPGSPVEMMLGAKPTAQQIEAATRKLGLDRPIPVQFWLYVKAAGQGDLGTSLRTSQPVLRELSEKAAATVELVTIAMALSLILGIPIGAFAAIMEGGTFDYGARLLAIAGVAVPAFLGGMILQMGFYGALGWLPLQGRISTQFVLDYPFQVRSGLFLVDTALSGNWPAFRDALAHLVLPVVTLTLASVAVVIRMTRSTMIDVLGEDHIMMARAFQLPRRVIYFRYALKATLVPLLTVVGLTYGYMLGGSIVVEYVFDWPGLGGYAVNAVVTNDFPAVMGVTFLLASAYLLINLAIDILYFAVDPRLRSA